jgi:hypothetical protein
VGEFRAKATENHQHFEGKSLGKAMEKPDMVCLKATVPDIQMAMSSVNLMTKP